MNNAKLKLNHIYVDGYKNLSECSIDLNDFNVLVGQNNSGKSNFLEIFAFVQGLVRGSEKFHKAIFEQGSVPRGDSSVCHTNDKSTKPITIQFSLEADDNARARMFIVYSLIIHCNSLIKNGPIITDDNLGFISELITYKDKKKTGKATVLIKRDKNVMSVRKENTSFATHNIESYSSCLSVTRAIYPGYEGLDQNFSFIYLSLLRLLASRTINLSANQLSEDLESGKKPEGYKLVSYDLLAEIAELNKNKETFQNFKNILCQILDFENVSFDSVKVPANIRKDSKDIPEIINFFTLKLPNCQYSRLDNFSDGTFRVVALLLSVLSQEKDSVLNLIEEPENCLHPKALKTLISFLKQRSNEKQILITTHSSYLIDNVSPEDIIVARIKEDGNTAFEKIQNIKDLRKRLSRGFMSLGDHLYDNFIDE